MAVFTLDYLLVFFVYHCFPISHGFLPGMAINALQAFLKMNIRGFLFENAAILQFPVARMATFGKLLQQCFMPALVIGANPPGPAVAAKTMTVFNPNG